MPVKISDVVKARTYIEKTFEKTFPDTLLTYHVMHTGSVSNFPNIMIGLTNHKLKQAWLGIIVKNTKPVRSSIVSTLSKGREKNIKTYIIYRISPTEYEFTPDLIDDMWRFIQK